MKTTAALAICTAFFAFLIAEAFADDDSSDAELLGFARNRAQLERVTANPMQMNVRTYYDCVIPVEELKENRAVDPHRGAAIHVYASSGAVAPLWDPYGTFPVGSILLKEKLDVKQLDKPTLFTGMIKRKAGYFPDCGDWEFFTLDGELTKVAARGKLESCAACHRTYAKSDFVSKDYTTLLAHSRTSFIDGVWRGVYSITAGSSHVFCLPANLAQTHGPKLSRSEASSHWYKTREKDDQPVPDDLSSMGGPTLRYEPDEKKNTLGYWMKIDDWASWNIDVRKAGSYDISVLQGCGQGSGGAEVALSLADQTVTFVVEDTGHFQNFKWRDIGQVDISAPGEYTLTVKPQSKPGVAVMDLRQIILRPTGARSEK